MTAAQPLPDEQLAATPPPAMRWILPGGDQHVEAWTDAAHWVHANVHINAGYVQPSGRNTPCLDCWRAAVFAIKAALLAGYRPKVSQAPMTAADLRDRIAAALRDAAHDCDGNCGLDEQQCLEQHPLQAAVLGPGGTVTDVAGPITALADIAATAVRDELDQLRAGSVERAALLEEARDVLEAAGMPGAHGDDWPAVAPAIRALAAERDAARAQVAAVQAALTEPGLHPEQRLRAIRELLDAADPTTT